MWTLIIVAAGSLNGSWGNGTLGGTTVALDHVPGFQTEGACNLAADRIRMHNPEVLGICVSQKKD